MPRKPTMRGKNTKHRLPRGEKGDALAKQLESSANARDKDIRRKAHGMGIEGISHMTTPEIVTEIIRLENDPAWVAQRVQQEKRKARELAEKQMKRMELEYENARTTGAGT